MTWIFDIIFKSGAAMFTGNTKSIHTGLLVLLCFELIIIIIIYLNRWRVPAKATWTLIGLGCFLYLGIIGIGFLE